jgi:hypothetical protein
VRPGKVQEVGSGHIAVIEGKGPDNFYAEKQ